MNTQAQAEPISGTPVADSAGGVTRQTSVYVYEAPVRIWNWVNEFAIFALCLTGYLI